MPIKACADRLRGEIEAYGNPPVIPDDEEPPAPEPDDAAAAASAEPTKFKAKKGKATAKKGRGVTQWDILKNSGISEADIHMFQYDSSPSS
jgi:leucyl-tRNA synthetase